MLRRSFRYLAVAMALLHCGSTAAPAQDTAEAGESLSGAGGGGAIVAPVKRVRPKNPVLDEGAAQGHKTRKVQLVPEKLSCESGFKPDPAGRACVATGVPGRQKQREP